MSRKKKFILVFLIFNSFYLKKSFADSVYQNKRPSFGLQFTIAPEAFSNNKLSTFQGSSSISGLEMAFSYQPSFLQDYGILGIGPILGVYPIFANSELTANFASIWSWGGHVQYQARYFHQQVIVPVLGYEVRQTAYHFISESYGKILVHGPKVGLWFFLNVLDPRSATHFYLSTGVLRTYLLLDALYERGINSSLSIRDWTYKIGLRVEF